MPKAKPLPYVEEFSVILEQRMPDDATYVLVCQKDGQANPSVVHNIDGSLKDVAKALRDLADALTSDA